MVEVPFAGRLDRQLAIAAQRLYMRPGRRAVVLLALGFLLLCSSVVVLQGTRFSLVTLAELAAFMLLWLASLWFLTPLLNARRVERTSKLFASPLHGVATETGIHLESAYGTSDLPWDVFFRYKATDSLVILFQSTQLFNVFPRSFFGSDEDWHGFRVWVADKVPATPRKRARASLQVQV
jgi:hypothetical protein